MDLAEKLKRLARIVPGVRGYQDSETSRDTDKAVRLRLSAEIEGLKLEVEKEKRRSMDKGELSLLPALDTLASKMDRVANSVKYAERGYSGIFDIHRVDEGVLDKLYSFDLALFDETEKLKVSLERLHNSSPGSSEIKEEISRLDEAVEEFGKTFSTRGDISQSR